ncbi:MAG: acetyltransferase family protein [Bacteroidetes bacterium]|nr:acetyltransferase family protein [Bacteroidota bacterium]
MNIIETDRLVLRKLTLDDAKFILDLLNQPSFIQFIGDRGVRTLGDARDYLSKRLISSYERFGFGLYLTLLKESDIPIGICGLVKRESLEDVDVGFAFLPQYWSKGYAFESASAVLASARDTLVLKRIVGITTPDNQSSIKVLEKMRLKFEKMVKLSEDDIELKLFVSEA